MFGVCRGGRSHVWYRGGVGGEGRVNLYSEVQCIMDNGHMGSRPVDRQMPVQTYVYSDNFVYER